ncbi:daptide-type RiPP [Streptomyces sp. WAC 06725]|nr:daptide-type RiPP [Streptomyces sp. WAC 06725]
MEYLDLVVEELEAMDSPFDVGHFSAGFASGMGLVGLGVAVAT